MCTHRPFPGPRRPPPAGPALRGDAAPRRRSRVPSIPVLEWAQTPRSCSPSLGGLWGPRVPRGQGQRGKLSAGSFHALCGWIMKKFPKRFLGAPCATSQGSSLEMVSFKLTEGPTRFWWIPSGLSSGKTRTPRPTLAPEQGCLQRMMCTDSPQQPPPGAPDASAGAAGPM